MTIESKKFNDKEFSCLVGMEIFFLVDKERKEERNIPKKLY